jgi:hypothetical protein
MPNKFTENRSFIYPTLYFSLTISIIGSFLLIYPFNSEPYFGLFLWFIILLAGSIFTIYKIFGFIRKSIINMALILSYLFITFGFILNTKSHLINIILLLAILPVINLSLVSNILYKNFIWRALMSGIYYSINKLIAPFIYLMEFLKLQRGVPVVSKYSSKFSSTFQVLAIFLLTGLPVIIIVVSLLASANDEFSKVISSLFNFRFTSEIAFGRLLFIVFGVPYFIGEIFFLREILKHDKGIKDKDVKFSKTYKSTFSMIAIITIFILNMFYLVFIFSEVKYDFGNVRELLFKKGLGSYSELAVSRFWELIAVTLINLSIVYFFINPFKHIKKSNRLLWSMGLLNVGLLLISTIFLLYSTHVRLSLYESGYGFTDKRLLAHLFLPVILVLSILVFGSTVYQKYNRLLRASIATLVVFFSLFIMLPTDYVTNKINYEMAKVGKIAIYDPTYSIPVYYTLWEHQEGALQIPSNLQRNNVRTKDGLIIAKELLNQNQIQLSTEHQKLLESEINSYRVNEAKMDRDWREYNLMRDITIKQIK